MASEDFPGSPYDKILSQDGKTYIENSYVGLLKYYSGQTDKEICDMILKRWVYCISERGVSYAQKQRFAALQHCYRLGHFNDK